MFGDVCLCQGPQTQAPGFGRAGGNPSGGILAPSCGKLVGLNSSLLPPLPPSLLEGHLPFM